MEILNDLKGCPNGKVTLTKDDVEILKDALIFYRNDSGIPDDSLTINTLIQQLQFLQDSVK